MMFEHNEVFEGFKDKTLFRIPHGLHGAPKVIDSQVIGLEAPNYYLGFNKKDIYIVFKKAPNKRFIFSWE